MKYRHLYLIAVFLILVALTACSAAPQNSLTPAQPADGRLQVTVTFNAMEELTRAVGGDRVTIHTIIPPGTEPHDFEPRSQDLVTIQNSAVMVFNGAGMEPWIEDMLKSVDSAKLLVVNASDGVDLLYPPEAGHEGETEAELAAHDHAIDPHIWMSLKQAAVQAENITRALAQADPANKTDYEKNFQAFKGQLDALYAEYQPKFESASRKQFVTGHAAFGYLCRDFGLQQMSVEGLFAEGEPTMKQLGDLIEFSKAHGVTTIFSEALVSPQISETLAREVGATVVPIYTISAPEDGLTYLERMKINLERIYAALTD